MSAAPSDDGSVPVVSLPNGVDLETGADIALEFDSGTSLRAHSYLLRLASPVFAKMFEEVEGECQAVKLQDDCAVWSLLLSSLHTNGVQCFAAQLPECSLARLKEIVRGADKYEIQAALGWVDELVSDKIREKKAVCHRCGVKCSLQESVVYGEGIFALLEWLAASRLRSAFDAAVDYMAWCCAYGFSITAHGDGACAGAASRIATLARKLFEEGYTEQSKRITEELWRRMRTE